MSNIVGVVIGIALLLYIVGIPFLAMQGHKKHIRATLESRGAEIMSIEYIPLTLDRSNYSYEVSYHDANGKFHMTKCKMSMIDEKIYWMDEDIRD